MLNSILLTLSTLGTKNKFAYACRIIWCMYIIYTSCTSLDNFFFLIVNISVFSTIVVMSCIAGRFCSKIRLYLSTFSILIYSFLIDTVCYFFIPSWSVDKTFIAYIIQGFLFNYRYIFTNICVILLLYSTPQILSSIISFLKVRCYNLCTKE